MSRNKEWTICYEEGIAKGKELMLKEVLEKIDKLDMRVKVPEDINDNSVLMKDVRIGFLRFKRELKASLSSSEGKQ